MFEIFKAIVLGFVQGATEFIPVSSSGHLVVVPWLLGWEDFGILFDTVLHWGTLLAIVIIFWRDFWAMILAALNSIIKRSLADPMARLAWFIVIGSIPAGVTGLLLKDFIEGLFNSPRAAGFFLLITAALLAGSEQMAKRLRNLHSMEKMTLWDSILIGLAQAVALAPGISRSGSTIAAGLALGIRRDEAARYSFLLGTPAFLGAGLLSLSDALAENAALVSAQMPILVVGFIVSAVTGFAAIRFLLAYLRTRSLYLFSAYCLILGLAVIGLSFVR